jgi:hypothetical protein
MIDRQRRDDRSYVIISGNVMSAVDIIKMKGDEDYEVIARYSLIDRHQAHLEANRLTAILESKHRVLWWDGTPWWVDQARADAWEEAWKYVEDIEEYEVGWERLIQTHGGVRLSMYEEVARTSQDKTDFRNN